MPVLAKRLNVHLFLRLVDNMMTFGPSAFFSTERYMYVYMHMQQLISFSFTTEFSRSILSSQGRRYRSARILCAVFVYAIYASGNEIA